MCASDQRKEARPNQTQNALDDESDICRYECDRSQIGSVMWSDKKELQEFLPWEYFRFSVALLIYVARGGYIFHSSSLRQTCFSAV